jgi:hypothetical protein
MASQANELAPNCEYTASEITKVGPLEMTVFITAGYE